MEIMPLNKARNIITAGVIQSIDSIFIIFIYVYE